MTSSLTKQEYVEYIKLQVTGGLLELEITDEVIGKYVDAALKELQRYIDQTVFITVPYASCIDLTGFEKTASAVIDVYRTVGFTGDTTSSIGDGMVDPMYAQTWMVFASGGTYNLQNYVMNYLSYNTLLQMRNTASTDLDWREGIDTTDGKRKLYINANYDTPRMITIEYVPIFTDVSQIVSDYWIDILKRLSVAMVKVALGRIRTRFTQTNALWTDDGATMLQEGTEELKDLRDRLNNNSNLFILKD